MSELKIDKEFAAEPETVFDYITQPDNLKKWFGPETMHVVAGNMDLSSPGDWSSTIANKDGQHHKVSGKVLEVNPPSSVEFTWAWHDEQDVRGTDTLVRFEVSAREGGGSKFSLIHTGLADDESAANHNLGWSSSFNKLAELLA